MSLIAPSNLDPLVLRLPKRKFEESQIFAKELYVCDECGRDGFLSLKAVHGHKRSCPKRTQNHNSQITKLPSYEDEFSHDEYDYENEDSDIEVINAVEILVMMKHSAVDTINEIKIESYSKAYTCKECNRSFATSQALGGHMSGSCNKNRLNNVVDTKKRKKKRTNDQESVANSDAKMKHICNECGKEFDLGQALGGHMTKHREERARRAEAAAASTSTMPSPELS